MRSHFVRLAALLTRSPRRPARRSFRPTLERLEIRALRTAGCLPAAAPFDHLYAFGESMSDNGNFYRLSGQPVAPYDGGRFTNGPVWVEYLAHDLGLGANRLTDLAYSGAGSGTSNVYIADTNSPLYATGLQTQVNGFLASHPSADPKALYTVWIGTNDYARHPADPKDVVANIATAVGRLAAAGAQNILVANLPDLATLPGIRNLGPRTAQLSALAATHDADLAAALGTLAGQYGNAHIMSLDIRALYNQMLTNPGTFGFTDVTDSALGNTVFISQPPSPTTDLWKTNPSAVLFWDSIHPTTAGHQVIADYARAVLTKDLGLANPMTVTNLNDSGIGSLRYELALAQDGATIAFAPHLHGTITLTSGELQVGASITIQGPGHDWLAISGDHASRVFEILPGATAAVTGLTICGGTANAADSPVALGQGGGVLVDPGAALTLSQVTVTGNVANSASSAGFLGVFVAGNGGGIYNAGTLTLNDTLVRNNTANKLSAGGAFFAQVSGIGGGIYNAGTLTVTGGAITDNTANAGASSGAAAGEGGGVYSSGTLTLDHVSVSRNTANAGPVTADVTGAALGRGGGLFLDAGTASVVDSVLADDTANAASASAAGSVFGGANVAGKGGGIFANARLTVEDTLFLGDVANAGSALGGHVPHVVAAGGAIFSGGQLTVDASQFFANVANTGKAAIITADGGAIRADAGLTLSGSLVSDNTANIASGAIEVFAGGGGLSTAGGSVAGSIIAFNVVNSGSVVGLVSLFGGAIEDTGDLTVKDSAVLFNNVNTNPETGQAFGLDPFSADGAGIEVSGGAARLLLIDSSVAGNFVLDRPSDLGVQGGGQVDPASADNLVGTGGSGGLVNGVNGNVVL
jgi:phospholipase/lecithinase/hemolysin